MLQWFDKHFPQIKLILRGDSGFVYPELYNLLEECNVKYIIRLKANNQLYQQSEDMMKTFYKNFDQDYTKTQTF